VPFAPHRALMQAHLPLIVRVLLLFAIALLLRVSGWYYNAMTDSADYLLPDASSYYSTAVNLANGHGYVLKQGQEPYFFREPATIHLYAASVVIYRLVTGRAVAEPSYDRNNWPQDDDNQHVIRLVRLSQAMLQAVALVLFYLLLRHYFKDGFSFTVAMLVSLYPPLASFSEHLLRENLLFGILIALAYVLSSHIQRPAYWKLAVIGVLWGISALTLQVYMLLGVILIAFVCLRATNVLQATKRCAVIGAVFLLTVLPWLYNVYMFYPDVRVARSMGCALTTDWIKFNTSLEFARSHPQGLSHAGVIPPDELLATDVYALTTSEYFEKAFGGYFAQAARRLDLKYGVPSAKDRVTEYLGLLGSLFVLPGYQYGDWSGSRSVAAHDHGNMVGVMYISVVLSVFAMIGLWMCRRKALDMLPIYLFHVAFFWILMSASRRALPIVPFFVLFGVIGLAKTVQVGFPQFRFAIFKEDN
jgi:hypothetical protein